MQTKRSEQPTFFDLAVQQRSASNPVLDTIAREVDFTEAEARVAATYSQGGRLATRVGVLLRVMILQHLYGLSDPQAETQINDRLSFQKFLQLDMHEVVPDETTICRFRQQFIECGLHEQLLALLNSSWKRVDTLSNAPRWWMRPTWNPAANALTSKSLPAALPRTLMRATPAKAGTRFTATRRTLQRWHPPTHPRRRPQHGQDLRRKDAAANHARRHAGGVYGQSV